MTRACFDFSLLRFAFCLALPLLCASAASAQDTHLLVDAGVGGDPEHVAQFTKWATAVVDGAKKHGTPDANITLLGENPEESGGKMKGRATRDAVTKAFNDIAAVAKPNDEIFVLLIGHGSFDGKSAAFNLLGPDLSAADYAT